MEMTPAQRTLRARVAAHTSWANTSDRAARTARARQAATDRFEKLVDPEGVLSVEERQQCAASAKKAHYLKMAAASAAARRTRRGKA
jgi:hypothetical protein